MQPASAISDPKAMRALAHRARLRLLGEPRQRAPQNFRTLSVLVGEPPNSVSYHPRTLAKYGFVAVAPGRATDDRESWWRALHRRTSWDPESVARRPELRTAGAELERRALVSRWEERSTPDREGASRVTVFLNVFKADE